MLSSHHNRERSESMYLRILKKDLKRKRTMNAIMLIFIILAAMFISSSANNLITIATALDDYFELAKVPDYWYATPYEGERDRFEDFAKDHGYGLTTAKCIQINPQFIQVDGEAFEYSNVVCLSTVEKTKVFDSDEKQITHVKDGEIYVTNEIFHSKENHFYEGCKIEIATEREKKTFTLKGCTKDALFGSSMIGMTRFLVSENDYKFFDTEDKTIFYSLAVYTEDASFIDNYNELDLKTIMGVNRSGIKLMYFMDTLIAAIILVVSLCLILISMVILRFTIHFTMSEEFREIGVMKAIGITNEKIRGLYIVKYLAISLIGSALGFALSIPFGNLLIESVSNNIIISGKNKIFLNLIFSLGTAMTVVLFCYLCTRKIRKFSPIDAIRNGETGERYKGKGILHLSRSHLPTVPFLSANDILSGLRKYVTMILIFTLGLLLIIIPVNTINTLQSDNLITMFSMADCDLVISQALLFSQNARNEELIREKLDDVRKVLKDHSIDADVFQEIMFRLTVSHGEKKTTSLAFQGTGGVTAEQYAYLKGTPPQNKGEVALSYITADNINADIGDEVEIDIGGETRKYTVTAINQSMNNLGEGIRFYQEEDINYDLAAGNFGIQISYRDVPDKKTFDERKELLRDTYPEEKVYTAGEYISYMIGDVAEQIDDVKRLILGIIICINMLVAVLMVKSFITKEKGEIAILKAIGFKNSSLVAWQSLRIGIVLLLSILIGTAVSTPLSKLTVEPIFRIMGAYSIQFEVVPLEVYVTYPLMVLFATVFAAALGALQLRKISASETSNIE